MTTYETRTRLTPEEVIERAERFFAAAGSPAAAFVEKRGPRFLKLHRDMGEVYVAALPEREWTLVRGSASRGAPLLARFFTALAPANDVAQVTQRRGVSRISSSAGADFTAGTRRSLASKAA